MYGLQKLYHDACKMANVPSNSIYCGIFSRGSEVVVIHYNGKQAQGKQGGCLLFSSCLSTPIVCTPDRGTHAFTHSRKNGLTEMSHCKKKGMGACSAIRLAALLRTSFYGGLVLDLSMTWT